MSDVRRQARDWLDRVKSRTDARRLGAELDAQPHEALRRALVDEGRSRGAELPDDAVHWPGKRLLRVARARSVAAQVRKNPIAVDESFRCAHCERDVPPAGRTARNHCPWCLHSLHVDIVPGDRASDCGGLLKPVNASLAHGTWTLEHLCARCGARRRVKVLADVDVPDDLDMLRAVSARG